MSRDRPRIVFAFLIVFGAALFVARPEPSPAQTVFRVLIVATGRVGLAVPGARKR